MDAMSHNKLLSIETRYLIVAPPSGSRSSKRSMPAIFAVVSVNDLAKADTFLREVFEAVRNHRLGEPIDTFQLSITLFGVLSASEFSAFWNQAMLEDLPMQVMFGRIAAEVLWCIAGGQLKERMPLNDWQVEYQRIRPELLDIVRAEIKSEKKSKSKRKRP